MSTLEEQSSIKYRLRWFWRLESIYEIKRPRNLGTTCKMKSGRPKLRWFVRGKGCRIEEAKDGEKMRKRIKKRNAYRI